MSRYKILSKFGGPFPPVIFGAVALQQVLPGSTAELQVTEPLESSDIIHKTRIFTTNSAKLSCPISAVRGWNLCMVLRSFSYE